MLDTVRPSVSLSLDLDNLWSYMKTHGDPGWESFPSYLDDVVDLILDRLSAHGLRITFFIVGQDAALEKNRAALRAIADAGHEIGNHSFHHEPWLHLRKRAEIDAELALAEDVIFSTVGRRPRGFRGPGFSLSADTLDVLSSRGYLYDASTFPTYLGPLARRYYLSKASHLTKEERDRRSRLFGAFAEGRRPLRPYLWKVGDGSLVEIPVTTTPGLRTPFHLSYVVYLSGFARQLGLGYFRSAAASCRAFGVEPSFLLHPLDFIGGDRLKELSFFPGMNLPTAFKLDLFDEVADYLKHHYTVLTMEQHASKALGALQVRGAGQQVYAG